MEIKVNYDKCCWKDGRCSACGCKNEKCSGCVEACPVKAITRKKSIEINKKLCILCEACVFACPKKALSLV